MEHATYLIIAYMAIWGGLAGYLLWLSNCQRRTARQLELLCAQLEQQEDLS
ncbi:CcmD family protein [Geothermobacter hydrogeniphilus]|uniref:CcmD family protein n=1 Tax=Geothermobacter hydrogeniphilus TaxID=1969733 RepID=A0A1X0Y655_9BACT|nr:CcmD family protein [Geothermobacter hydrogeniphilus]ORJ60587.1 hypothetical protein B5V00_07050 [Geothermobacter hydrogeniphilus]